MQRMGAATFLAGVLYGFYKAVQTGDESRLKNMKNGGLLLF